MTPTLHEDFEINQRVSFEIAPYANQVGGLKGTGTIVGISFAHAIFTYIILLDTPLQVPDYDQPWRAVTIPGGQLKKI